MKNPPFFLILLCLHLLYPAQFIFAQDFKLLHVNADSFPVIEGVFSLDQTNSRYLSQTASMDFEISENNKSLEILNIVNPTASVLPLSIVLVVDVSGSMSHERIQIVKNAAINFINRVPLEVSEIALLSFNDQVIVNSDFTHSKSRLLGAVHSLEAFGGTNYNEAFLNAETGALKIGSSGIHKKIIVFLTDGLSKISEEEVISEATAGDITVFNVSIELDMPESLKNISRKTGGEFYETVQSEGEVGSVYNSIVYSIQSELYGHIFWKAPHGCNKERTGTLTYKGFDYAYAYFVPSQKTGMIHITPDDLFFGNILPGESAQMKLNIEVFNSPIYLNNIDISNNNFALSSKTFGDTLFPDQTNNLFISYTSVDEGLNTARLTFNFENCPQKTVSLKGGMAEEVEIIYPKGGELFSSENSLGIRWKGIKSSREVDIYYRKSDKHEWNFISSADNQLYSWRNHADTGHNIQIMIQPKAIIKPDLIFRNKIVINGSRPIAADINPHNGQLLYVTERGDASVINLTNGAFDLSARGLGREGAFFTETGKIASIEKDKITLHNNIGLTIAGFRNVGSIANSITLNNEKEYLLYPKIKKINDEAVEIRSLYSDTYDTLMDPDPIESASITLNGESAVSLHESGILKIWHRSFNQFISRYVLNGYQDSRVILSPDNQTGVCLFDNRMSMIDLVTGEIRFTQQGYRYRCFSKSGDLVMAFAADSSLSVFDSYTGNTITKLEVDSKILTFKNRDGFVFYQNDSLCFYNPKAKEFLKRYTPSLAGLLMSPDDSKVLLLFQNGHHSLVDSRTFDKICEFTSEPAMNYLAVFSEINNNIILFIDNRLIEVWTPEIQSFKADVSNPFSIVNPRLTGLGNIELGEQFINTSKEYTLKNLYKNTGKVRALIKDITLMGNDAEEFELVKGIQNDSLSPGEFTDAEIRFSPRTEGEKSIEIKAFTFSDTLVTHIRAHAVAPGFKQLNPVYDFGTVDISESKTSLIPLIENLYENKINTGDLKLMGPDTTQFNILFSGKKNVLLRNDTLYAEVKFTGTARGLSSTVLHLKAEGIVDYIPFMLIGNVDAPGRYLLDIKTLNSTDSLPIPAEIDITDLESGSKIFSGKTDMNGSLHTELNPERNYAVFAEKDGYLTSSTNINLTKNNADPVIYSVLLLPPIEPGAQIAMNCIFFEFSTDKLLEESIPELNKTAEFLKNHQDISVEIHGHTDSVGSKEYNTNLSERRARAVVNFLVSAGIHENRLSIKAWGYEKPLADNNTEEGRAQNRRVEIVIK